jgi:hypothetical protein
MMIIKNKHRISKKLMTVVLVRVPVGRIDGRKLAVIQDRGYGKLPSTAKYEFSSR